MNSLEKLVSGITLAGVLAISSPAYAQESNTPNANKTIQLEDSLRNLPPELGQVEVFPTEGATRVVVHVRDLHSVEDMTSFEKSQVTQVQNNIYNIITHLSSKYEGVEVYCEGTLPNQMSTLKDVANTFEIVNYVKPYHPRGWKSLRELFESEISRLRKEEPESPGITFFSNIVTSEDRMKKLELNYTMALEFMNTSASLKYMINDQGIIHPAESESLLDAATKIRKGITLTYVHEARESKALEIISEGSAPLPVLVFGGNHNLVGKMRTVTSQNNISNNIQTLNDSLEDGSKFSLIVITPTSYLASEPESKSSHPPNITP